MIVLPNEKSTFKFASQLSWELVPGAIIFLKGSLGAGKTTLVRGVLAGMGYDGNVKSPTYALVESYEVTGRLVHHFDLYRLSEPEELEQIGIRDYLDSNALLIFEWPEKGKGILPEADLEINIKILEQGREIIFENISEKGKQILQGLKI